MKRFARAALMTLVMVLMVNGPVFGDSLWTDSGGSRYAAQTRQFSVGDLITIIIVEQATATQNAGSSNSKEGSVSAGGTGKLSDLIPGLGGNWDSDYEGEGSTNRRGAITANLTATVIDITPEGLLVLEGKQEIHINRENQVITIKGKVRPEDISNISNSVSSTYVADAVIEYDGKGTLGDVQRPGILTRFFQWVF